MKVYNKRRANEIPTGAIYVGRPTKWGNPFSKGSKSQNIADFQEYAEGRHTRDPNWLKPLAGKHLVCWCSPNRCHADILIQMANEPTEQDWDADAWADKNAPTENVILDRPSDWEIQNGLG